MTSLCRILLQQQLLGKSEDVAIRSVIKIQVSNSVVLE
jgi:hypothetical protein